MTVIKEIAEDQMASMKKGIVTILRSDPETPAAKSTSSIRRTLSADMSSKNWLAMNGPTSTGSPNPGQDEVWRSIQSQKKELKDHAKRSSSSTLSAKSLEICTESLGSETGSDSLLSPEASGDRQEAGGRRNRARVEEEEKEQLEELSVVKYKRAPPLRPFPPPIHSMSSGGDSSLRVQPRREEGRLVLEAVTVPPRNYFHAHRSNGRLVLTLIPPRKASDDGIILDDENKEGGDKYEVVERELGSLLPPKRIISVHKSSLVMMEATFLPGNKEAKIIEEEGERDQLWISKSLPPPPRVSSWMIKPTSFEGYGYFWRNKKKVVFFNPVVANNNNNNSENARLKNDYCNENVYVAKAYMNEDVVVTMSSAARGGKVESFVSYLKGCKESKRSTLRWEPHCIATSSMNLSCR